MKTPPQKPSALIELALKDLNVVERSKKYVVDMDEWHQLELDNNDKEMCAVCFAGAVMAKTLKAKFGKSVYPDDFEKEWENAFRALDSFREGCVSYGFRTLGLVPPDWAWQWYEDNPITPYRDDPKKFKQDIRNMVKKLKKEGY